MTEHHREAGRASPAAYLVEGFDVQVGLSQSSCLQLQSSSLRKPLQFHELSL